MSSQTTDLEAAMGGATARKAKEPPAPPQDDRVEIILEENETIPPTGLYVGVNGRGYLLTPGTPIKVPRAVLEVLDNAVMSVPQRDPQTQQVLAYRDRLRYPYRRVNM